MFILLDSILHTTEKKVWKGSFDTECSQLFFVLALLRMVGICFPSKYQALIDAQIQSGAMFLA